MSTTLAYKRGCEVTAATVLTLGSFAFQAVACAQDAGWYVGGGDVSHARLMGSIDSSRYAPGFAPESIRVDKSDTGWKVFGGYQFSRNFALEGGHIALGRFSAMTSTPGTLLHLEFKPTEWYLDAVGILPLGRGFSLAGRAGFGRSDTEVSLTSVGALAAPKRELSADKWSLKVGVGATYKLTDNFGFRAELERYRVSNGVGGTVDVDAFSATLSARF